MPGFAVGVDYGSASTVAVLRRPDGQVRPLLFDGSPLLPSACFVEKDGHILVGRDAERSARLDPTGYLPDPKGRLDEGQVPVRGELVPVGSLVAAALVRVGQEAIRSAGGAVPRLVLAHPASWSEDRRRILTEAAAGAGLGVPALVPAALAIAWHRAGSTALPPGRFLLVYDIGAGGCDVSLLRRDAAGFEIVGTENLPGVGGLELDRALTRTIGAELASEAADQWWRLSVPATVAERRHRLDMWDQVREAKEALSRQPAVGLHVPLVDREVWVTSERFERVARPALLRTVEAAAALLADARVTKDNLAEVLLAGGSSRIPLVAELLQGEFGVRATPSEQPELDVAEGVLEAVRQLDAAAVPLGTPLAGPASPPAQPASPEGEPTLPLAVTWTPVSLATTASTGQPGTTDQPDRTEQPDRRDNGRYQPGLVAAVTLAQREPVPAGGPQPGGRGATLPDGWPGTASGPSAPAKRGRGHVVAAAAVTVVILALVALFAAWQPNGSAVEDRNPVVTGGSAAPSQAGGDVGLGGARATPPATPATTGGPTTGPSSASPSASPAPPARVTVTVTASPTSGTCATDFIFTGHFTVLTPGRYRWHWVFGGPGGYTATSGDHDQDKTGDVHLTRKFSLQSGTYWAAIRITSPVSVTSAPASVQVSCTR